MNLNEVWDAIAAAPASNYLQKAQIPDDSGPHVRHNLSPDFKSEQAPWQRWAHLGQAAKDACLEYIAGFADSAASLAATREAFMHGWDAAHADLALRTFVTKRAEPEIQVFAQSNRCAIRVFNQYTRSSWFASLLPEDAADGVTRAD